MGLLPDSLAKMLGMKNSKGETVAAISSAKKAGVSSCNDCCSGKGGGVVVASRCESSASTDSNCTTDTTADATTTTTTGNNDPAVQHITTLEQWNQIFSTTQTATSKNTKLFVKFTAEWCKPCHAIQPFYASIAASNRNKNNNNNNDNNASAKFITLDVDGEECDTLSSQYRIALMPTFVCFQNGEEVGRMNGGNKEDKLKEWVENMMAC